VTELPAAVLWDMDGTIIDTEPHWMDAETELVRSYGGSWSHDEALTLVGQGLWHSARVLQSKGVTLTEDEIIESLTETVLARIHASGLPWRPGARELLLELRAAGIPTALVTMSIHKMAHAVADAIDFTAFDVVVAGDEVEHSKPHPAAYLRATELLGVDPTRCVAIEDSGPGVAAAVAAGAATIGVPLNVSLDPTDRFTIWPTLVGRSIADLTAVLDERNTARSTS
jgi:HAD superfamily hydrolase (TIGR01509 family)